MLLEDIVTRLLVINSRSYQEQLMNDYLDNDANPVEYMWAECYNVCKKEYDLNRMLLYEQHDIIWDAPFVFVSDDGVPTQ